MEKSHDRITDKNLLDGTKKTETGVRGSDPSGSAGTGSGGAISTNVAAVVGMYGFGNGGPSTKVSGYLGGDTEGIVNVTPGQNISVIIGKGGFPCLSSNWTARAGISGLCIVECENMKKVLIDITVHLKQAMQLTS